METIEKDPVQIEFDEAQLLIDEGLIFETESRSFLKFFKKKRYWHIKPLKYGTMLMANKYAMQMKVQLQDQSISAALSQMDSNIRPLVNYISVCLLGSKWKILIFRKILTEYFIWRLPPQKSLKLVLAVIQMYDIANFITSIRLIGTLTSPKTEDSKTPSPNPIDGKQ